MKSGSHNCSSCSRDSGFTSILSIVMPRRLPAATSTTTTRQQRQPQRQPRPRRQPQLRLNQTRLRRTLNPRRHQRRIHLRPLGDQTPQPVTQLVQLKQPRRSRPIRHRIQQRSHRRRPQPTPLSTQPSRQPTRRIRHHPPRRPTIRHTVKTRTGNRPILPDDRRHIPTLPTIRILRMRHPRPPPNTQRNDHRNPCTTTQSTQRPKALQRNTIRDPKTVAPQRNRAHRTSQASRGTWIWVGLLAGKKRLAGWILLCCNGFGRCRLCCAATCSWACGLALECAFDLLVRGLDHPCWVGVIEEFEGDE